MTKEQHIKAFLESWIDWSDGDAVDREPYRRRFGLCRSLYDYLESSGVSKEGVQEVTREFHARLYAISGCNIYPFGADSYNERKDSLTQHLCPKRVKFVKDWLKELEHVA